MKPSHAARTVLVLGLAAAVAAAQATADDAPRADAPPPPGTVAEVVDVLRERLSAEDLEWMRRNPKGTVGARLHHGYGTGIRNEFGLWHDNSALMKSCGVDHPDDCSGGIIAALWDRIRAETEPALAHALDCQQAATERIRIDTTGWYLLTNGALVADMQHQVDAQAAAAATPACADVPAPRIVVKGDPDPACFVRVEFEHREDLATTLDWIGFRNAFRVTHEPPAIVLDFYEKCAWPERPLHFAPDAE